MLLGATKMDRPEWLAIDPQSQWVYCTLTYNNDRGKPGLPGADAANPRANQRRWARSSAGKDDGDFDATTFRWNHLVLAGNPASARTAGPGNIKGDIFAVPMGSRSIARGVLWIQTDCSASVLQQGRVRGASATTRCWPATRATGETRRFLSGPINCEITGAAWTPDGRTMFVNIQHPGETPSERTDPAQSGADSATGRTSSRAGGRARRRWWCESWMGA